MADVVLPGLAWPFPAGRPPLSPRRDELAAAFDGATVVVVENMLTLPLNPGASTAVADALRGRPAILHHFDVRPSNPGPPSDARWAHVVTSDLAASYLRDAHGIDAVRAHNRFAVPPVDELVPWSNTGVLLQPTRAIARKGIAVGLALAEALGLVYWLSGAVEEDYDSEMNRILKSSSVPVRRHPFTDPAAAYGSAAAVALPSVEEGFGNPSIESALHRRPLAIAPYPAAEELRAGYGFRWFPAGDPQALRRWLADPDPSVLDHNRSLAAAHFALDGLPAELEPILARVL